VKSTKHQAPNNKQIPMNKFPNPKQNRFDHLKIGIYLGFVIWNLEIYDKAPLG
jgi:hypothetical protein